MLKIKLPVEYNLSEAIWVRRITDNTGEIRNLPIFSKGYKFMDTIKFNVKTNEAVGIIHNGGYCNTRLVRYKASFQVAKTKWKTKGYVVEGLLPGIIGVSRKSSTCQRTGKKIILAKGRRGYIFKKS